MAKKRSRPSKELLARQRKAKARWRRGQAALPFREKVRLLLELQRQLYPIIKARREMRPWEKPWEIEP